MGEQDVVKAVASIVAICALSVPVGALIYAIVEKRSEKEYISLLGTVETKKPVKKEKRNSMRNLIFNIFLAGLFYQIIVYLPKILDRFI